MPNLKRATDLPLRAEKPLYAKVRENIQAHIAKMNVGDRLSSERQLSEYFKVDRVTIRRAMMDLTREGFVVRHQGRGTFIRKLVSQEHQHLAGPRVIALSLPDVEIPQHASYLKGTEEAASAQGYQVWIRNAMFDSTRDLEILQSLVDEELAGIITCPFYGNVVNPRYAEAINNLLEKGKRVVLLDQYVPGANAPVAMVDKVKVGYIATEHLIMCGHRKIMYVSTATYDTSGDDSLRGYRSALEDYGLTFKKDLVINIPVESSAQPAHDIVHRILSESPNICSAIATPQFAMCHGIYKALRELKRSDIALIGNNMDWNPEYSHIPHTSQPYDQAGSAAVRLLLQRDDDQRRKKHVLIEPRLVVGQSLLERK